MALWGAKNGSRVYTFVRESQSLHRANCDRLWKQFAAFCPDNDFVKEFARHPQKRYWEMLLADILLKQEFKLERPPSQGGPDLKIVLPNGRVLWIEAVTCEPGEGENNATAIRHPNGRMFPQDNKTLLRYTSAVKDKHDQLKDRIASGVVSANDYYVVAVNGGLLDDFGDEGPFSELIFRSVYPIAQLHWEYQLYSEQEPRPFHPPEPSLAKAEGVFVNKSVFADGTYSGISGILFSRDKVWHPHPTPGVYCDYIPNATATTPLPPGTFNFGREYIFANGKIGTVSHSERAPACWGLE